jgi:hypothetical protein
MRLDLSPRAHRFASASALAALMTLGANAIDLSAQGRGFASGGGGMSTSRVASPAVVASWVAHDNHADGSATTLLVLWRGTPGWFSKGGRGGRSGGGGGSGGGSGSGWGQSGSYAYEYVSQGGLTFMMEFDYEKRIVKILNQEISLKDSNVVLVDFVDSTNGPTIVDYRWVDPAQPDQPPVADPIAAVIKRTPELFEYLRCDVSLSDPLWKAMMPNICGQMRP